MLYGVNIGLNHATPVPDPLTAFSLLSQLRFYVVHQSYSIFWLEKFLYCFLIPCLSRFFCLDGLKQRLVSLTGNWKEKGRDD